MAKIAHRSTGDITGYVLWDEPDELLRKLSPQYLGLCREKLWTHLRALCADPADLRFGWLHPGVACVPAGRESPFAFVGWLWADRRPPLTELHEASLAEALLIEHPRLRWGASYRSGIFDCDPRDPDHILDAIREYVLDDPSAGDPEWLAAGAGGAPLIEGIVDACTKRDRTLVLSALARARDAYSADGADLLRTAVLQWFDGPGGT